MTVFLRTLEAAVDEKSAQLLSAVTALQRGEWHAETFHRVVFERDLGVFATLPGSPFAYWVSGTVRGVFERFERFEGDERTVKQGHATRDDFRFVRLWWEIEPADANRNPKWPPFAKGGAFGPFYSDVTLRVRWDAVAEAAYAERTSNFNVLLTSSREEFLYRPGLTWPLRAHRFAPQAMPEGCIFSARGYCAFTPRDQLLSTLALLNSSCFDYLFKLLLGRSEYPEFIVGILQQMPWPTLPAVQKAALARLGHRAWSLTRLLDTANETSPAFLLPTMLNAKATCLDRIAIERELESLQKQIDDAAFALYGIGSEDRVAIEASSRRLAFSDDPTEELVKGDSDDETDSDSSLSTQTDRLNSWLVGVAFGRFDPRLATGEREIPSEPDPFDRLPSLSPGMYPAGEEPADRPDVLVDDEGQAGDLEARVHVIADRVHVDLPENFRAWLAQEFFQLHIKMYSKSRRKAPIYWQLATPSASYSVWLYIHAFSKDTLFRVQSDYAAPKLAHEERRLESLTNELRDDATAAQRKELAAQEASVEELRAFLEEVKRIVPLWNPDLDDGVIINFAPLWRLVPQNKSWQKELKATWDALCEGKYDWAHLAMHLWPERVVPNCAKDRSLAIAHGLEDVFWVEGDDGKWTARKAPTRSVDEIVRERTSPAVKSALKSLLEAPGAAGAAKKTKKGKASA